MVSGKYSINVSKKKILFDIDDKMRKQRYGRLTKITNEIVGQFANKYSLSTSLGDIVDEEDIAALKRLDYRDAQRMSPLVNRLKTESIKSELRELDEQIRVEGAGLRLKWRPERFLFVLLKHPDQGIQTEAKRIRNQINKITLGDVSRKYNMSTAINQVSLGKYQKQHFNPNQPSCP